MFFFVVNSVLVLVILLYFLNKRHRRDFIEDFPTKSVFITGTGSGFGRKLALDLDLKGVKVYAGCHSEQSAKDLQKEATSRMKILRIDVTNRESISKAKEVIECDLPANSGLWALVNNAGISKGEVFEFATVEDYLDVFNVNFFGPVQVTEIFLPMIKKSRGRIVNVSSILGRGNLFAGPYSASKHALEAYNDGLRRALKPIGVKVSLIEPGVFQTKMTNVSLLSASVDQQWNKLSPDLKEEYGPQFVVAVKKVLKLAFENPILSAYNKIDSVTSSMTHAIFAKHPKDRYTIGLEANLLLRPLSILPDVFIDTIYYLIYKKYSYLLLKTM